MLLPFDPLQNNCLEACPNPKKCKVMLKSSVCDHNGWVLIVCVSKHWCVAHDINSVITLM